MPNLKDINPADDFALSPLIIDTDLVDEMENPEEIETLPVAED